VKAQRDAKREEQSRRDKEHAHMMKGVGEAEKVKALFAGVLIEKGLPAQIMLSFPPSVREGEQGLKAWTHLFRRVVVVTDQYVGALQAYLDSPPAVSRNGMFGQAIVHLLNFVDRVDHLEDVGRAPYAQAKRNNLGKLSTKIPEACRA
jgi:hypothetical protein